MYMSGLLKSQFCIACLILVCYIIPQLYMTYIQLITQLTITRLKITQCTITQCTITYCTIIQYTLTQCTIIQLK